MVRITELFVAGVGSRSWRPYNDTFLSTLLLYWQQPARNTDEAATQVQLAFEEAVKTDRYLCALCLCSSTAIFLVGRQGWPCMMLLDMRAWVELFRKFSWGNRIKGK